MERKSKQPPAREKAKQGDKPAAKPAAGRRHSSARETVEAIIVAFVLAFLFRTFEAEAFVIPTGSMAPTLMGMHKDVVCDKCGYTYRAGASSEGEDTDANGRVRAPGPNDEVVAAICPNCRYKMNVDKHHAEGEPTYKGDRILVSKFPYDFAEPERWDVVVFKYPEGASQNYIKRLVGLPGETVVISGGNIYVEQDGDLSTRTIARKPPDKIEAIMQTVYDNDHRLPELAEFGWPERWQPADAAAAEAWTPSEDGKSFTFAGDGAEPVWLQYRHFAPTQNDWAEAKAGTPGRPGLRSQLITDYYAYNNQVTRDPRGDAPTPGLHWVGDLILECELKVESAEGQVTLRLVKAGRTFDCILDVATGQARLAISGDEGFAPTAETALRGPGDYDVRFANVDDQLHLWIDGAVAEFDAPTTYAERPTALPTAEDLAPVRVGVAGGKVTVDHLRILRDVYYVAQSRDTFSRSKPISDYDRLPFGGTSEEIVADFMSNPSQWSEMAGMLEASFPLGEDEFFMLGDNSPASADSRLWHSQHFVDRELLIGKALFIYWPHSLSEYFPFCPNVPRMGLVR